MTGTRRIHLILVAVASVVLTLARASRGDSAVDFNRDIRPILSDRCFACHGPDDKQRKARLRLDLRESALQPAKSGAIAIVPGKPDESELVKRVSATDPDEIMPPGDTGKTVTHDQAEMLKRWIAQGAEYRPHWAFVTPERPPVPQNPGLRTQGVNPIDAFIGARLEQEHLDRSAEADRTTLIRRATLDLTGLPPSPEEVDAFLANPSPKAYDALIDRLLDSPRYGERMAVEWLDAARYADTHGYHLDSGRDMTLWRDWVIRAFNENKPFDQFTIEQLAGDLLPEATVDQKIASGFNRNHMINYEGGAIPEEYHYAYLVDRVNTTATVWLGLTMACAQCHDHKYDPITKSDYYRFFAFFNNVPERGLDGNKGNASPVVRIPSPEQDRKLKEMNQALAEAEKRIEGPLPEIEGSQGEWERVMASDPAAAWTVLTPVRQQSAGGSELRALEDRSVLVAGPNPDRDTYSLGLEVPLARVTALRLEVLPDDSLARKGPGRAENGNFVLSGVRLASGGAAVRLKRVSADFSQPDYAVDGILDDRAATGWAIDGRTGKSHAAILELEAPTNTASLELTLAFQSNFPQHAIGRFRVSVTGAARPHELQPVPEELKGILARSAEERSDDDKAKLRKFYRESVSLEFRRLKDEVASLRTRRDELDAQIPSAMVMSEMEKPRDTFIHMRGEYDKLGDKVTAGTPAALPPLPTGEAANRLGLARWLVSPSHPLTARVAVNRYWQMYFGTGLVKTAEDFGSQGEWPTHLDLLDWLAREFIESGWDIKHLQRLILTSAAYRQSSHITPELHQRDPDNRLLARGPRFRLQAEFIRDQALAIAGILNGQIGGKSVSPYQPPGLWEELSMREDSKNFSAQFFVQSKGEDLYRRSMYTFWKRSSPPPQMSTFDAPDRETCTVRRPRTNTPLQALVLLNDPTYIEASRKLAERLMSRSGSDAERVAWAFRLATSRAPNAQESVILLRVLEQQRGHYAAHRAAAEELLSHGDASRDLTLDASELAAWTMVSSTILNLDETVTKG